MADPLRFAVDRVEEQERLRLVLQMRAQGYPQREIERGLRIRSMMDEYAKTGKGWDELAAAFKEVEKSSGPCNSLVLAGARRSRLAVAAQGIFSMISCLCRCYGAAPRYLFGENDTPTPVAAAVPRLEAGIEEQSEPRLVRTDHSSCHAQLLRRRNGGDREFPALTLCAGALRVCAGVGGGAIRPAERQRYEHAA